MLAQELMLQKGCPALGERVKGMYRDVLGTLEPRQWVLGSNVTVSGTWGSKGAYKDMTWEEMSGGLVKKFSSAVVLAQKLGSASTNKPRVDSIEETGFRLYGDLGETYSVVVLGRESGRTRVGGKWAKDYCPYCNARGYRALVGGVYGGLTLFGFKHAQTNAADSISFRNEVTMYGLRGEMSGGAEGNILVREMEDADYQIIITKSSAGAITSEPYPSAIGKTGFTLNGEAGEEYDVLVLGRVRC